MIWSWIELHPGTNTETACLSRTSNIVFAQGTFSHPVFIWTARIWRWREDESLPPVGSCCFKPRWVHSGLLPSHLPQVARTRTNLDLIGTFQTSWEIPALGPLPTAPRHPLYLTNHTIVLENQMRKINHPENPETRAAVTKTWRTIFSPQPQEPEEISSVSSSL